jgi:hypothetical protein
MAARTAAAGHEVRMWNRSKAGHHRPADELAEAAATGAVPPAAVAGADLVLTMLADAAALDVVSAVSSAGLGAHDVSAVAEHHRAHNVWPDSNQRSAIPRCTGPHQQLKSGKRQVMCVSECRWPTARPQHNLVNLCAIH